MKTSLLDFSKNSSVVILIILLAAMSNRTFKDGGNFPLINAWHMTSAAEGMNLLINFNQFKLRGS